MKEVKITADIYCDRNFKPLEFATDVQKSYRVYVDGDLLTERTYIWDNNEQFVRENIVVNIEPGVHEFKVIPAYPYYDVFTFKNFTVNNQPCILDDDTNSESLVFCNIDNRQFIFKLINITY
jgi:hypothetical protein